jgi:uncharacterized membrane protein
MARRLWAQHRSPWREVLTGVGMGAGLMYILDPASGRRRRRTVVDQTRSLARQSGRATGRATDALLASTRQVLGVRGGNRPQPDETGEGGPARQDGGLRAEFDLVRENWTPSLRCLAATAGSGLVAWGIRRAGGLGLAVGSAGAALLARAGSNRRLGKLIGLPGGPKLVEVHKTIEIQTPIDTVFELWTRFENFPRFMSTLKVVRDHGDGRSRWTVEGPGGVPVSWNAEVTRLVPNELLAWRSLPGSAVPNAGVIHFAPTAGGTRVDIQLGYDPPGGALGLLAAKLFGADARSRMDEDLMAMKAFLETGQTPPDAPLPPAEIAPPF